MAFHDDYISLNDAVDRIMAELSCSKVEAYRILKDLKTPIDSQNRRVEFIISQDDFQQELHYKIAQRARKVRKQKIKY